MKRLNAVEDTIIVREASQETKTKIGLIIPETAKGGIPNHGTIISVGPKAGYLTGDVIFYPPYAGVRMEFEGEKYLFLKPTEVLAFVELVDEVENEKK